MKILYAIQGTGNGHLSRARDIVPLLEKKGDVDILISGTQADVSLEYPIKYRLKGLGFIFGKKGGVDLRQTFLQASMRQFIKEVYSLPIEHYDLIINDFEPVSAWASKLKKKLCIGLSHQSAVLLPNAPQPKKEDALGRFILKHYAPASVHYGFHFESFDSNIFTPIIRRQIRQATVTDKGHYTVYLPAYADEQIYNVLSNIKVAEWQVFSKHNRKAFHLGNVCVKPLNNEAFIESMASCKGMLCGAGFETPAEALFLGKKLMVIAMKNQFEQQCNAAALKKIGIPFIKKLHNKHTETIYNWIENGEVIKVDYPDVTENIINLIIDKHAPAKEAVKEYIWDGQYQIKPI
jgi:uncharacterized protein (TIGR00661 family)